MPLIATLAGLTTVERIFVKPNALQVSIWFEDVQSSFSLK